MKAIALKIVILILAAVAVCFAQEKEKNVKPPKVAIHLAALTGNVKAINQHIATGSDLNEIDEYGSTPLIVAITFGKTQGACTLIEAGVDLTISNNDGSSPLHIASFLCRTEIVKSLLTKGADLNAKNKYGGTPLDGVTGPFEEVKPVYDAIGKGLKGFGLQLDYKRIQKTRPVIAEMLTKAAAEKMEE